MSVVLNDGTIIAVFERADSDAIEAWVAALPKDYVVETLFAVTELRRALYEGEKMLKSRIAAEEILSSAEVWTAPDGHDFMWAGDRERVVNDPAGLRAALDGLVVNVTAKRALALAFKEQPPKVYLTQLDTVAKFGGDEVERTIRSFTTWKESSPKLRPLDQDGR